MLSRGGKTGKPAFFLIHPVSDLASASRIAPDVQHSLSLISPSGQVKPVFHKYASQCQKRGLVSSGDEATLSWIND